MPDFGGSGEALRTVVDAAPDILAHNVETVPRLYPEVRRGADYGRSLSLSAAPPHCARGCRSNPGSWSGWAKRKRRSGRCSATCTPPAAGSLTVGQYLPPSRGHFPLVEYVAPERFEGYAALARRIGFREVRSAPLVRSSYNPG